MYIGIFKLKVLATETISDAKAGEPPFKVLFEHSQSKKLPDSNEPYEEKVIKRFKSHIKLEKGTHSVRCELGAYVDGRKAEIFGRILGLATQGTIPTTGKQA